MIPVVAIHLSWRVHFPQLVEALERNVIWALELEALGDPAHAARELEQARAIIGELVATEGLASW